LDAAETETENALLGDDAPTPPDAAATAGGGGGAAKKKRKRVRKRKGKGGGSHPPSQSAAEDDGDGKGGTGSTESSSVVARVGGVVSASLSTTTANAVAVSALEADASIQLAAPPAAGGHANGSEQDAASPVPAADTPDSVSGTVHLPPPADHGDEPAGWGSEEDECAGDSGAEVPTTFDPFNDVSRSAGRHCCFAPINNAL